MNGQGAGAETIPFSVAVKAQGNIEDWLCDLLFKMQASPSGVGALEGTLCRPPPAPNTQYSPCAVLRAVFSVLGGLGMLLHFEPHYDFFRSTNFWFGASAGEPVPADRHAPS